MSQLLIVDDAHLTRDALARLLQHEGYTTDTAPNGKDAWAMLYESMLRGHTPQLIILDLMMPQMDGVMFLKLLRRSDHWGQIPVLVLTGLSDEEHLVQRAKTLGVQDVISKDGSSAQRVLDDVRRIVEPECADAVTVPSDRPRTARRTVAV